MSSIDAIKDQWGGPKKEKDYFIIAVALGIIFFIAAILTVMISSIVLTYQDIKVNNLLKLDCPKIEIVKASWYDYDLDGAPGYSKTNYTAASRDYKRGTKLKVCNIENNKCVVVRVNDYGPSKEVHPDRGLDLSSFAFEKIANLSQGLIMVTIKEL